MRIDNARFTGSVDGSQAIASLSGSFTGSGHIELSNTASYNFASASISGSDLILHRADGAYSQSLTIISETSDTASYVSSSNVHGPLGMDTIQTASFALTASFITASNVHGPHGTSSVVSASYAISASHLIGLVEDAFSADFTGVTTFTVTHGLNTEDVIVQVYDTVTGGITRQFVPDTIQVTNANQVDLTFSVATTGYVVVSAGGYLQSGSLQNAQTASYATRVQNALSQGLGVDTFTYDGSATAQVQIDTGSTHFTEGVEKIHSSDTGSFVTGSVIVGTTQSFRLGDGTSYENYIASSSHASTASFVTGQSYNEAVTNAGAATFNITHNLDSLYPIVASYDTTLANPTQVIPDTVEIISANQVDVTFAGAFTGDIVVKK